MPALPKSPGITSGHGVPTQPMDLYMKYVGIIITVPGTSIIKRVNPKNTPFPLKLILA